MGGCSRACDYWLLLWVGGMGKGIMVSSAMAIGAMVVGAMVVGASRVELRDLSSKVSRCFGI